MNPMSIADLSASLVGAITPFVVQLLREKWLKCSNIAALWLSLAVSTGCVCGAYFMTDKTPSVKGLMGNVGLAFTLSQVVYRQVGVKKKDDDGGSEAP